MSNMNFGEKPKHRKLKVSWATNINPGLVGPKARPKGVVDGQLVNIPALLYVTVREDAAWEIRRIIGFTLMLCRLAFQANPEGHWEQFHKSREVLRIPFLRENLIRSCCQEKSLTYHIVTGPQSDTGEQASVCQGVRENPC